MRRNETRKLSDLLSEFRHQPNLEKNLSEAQLINNWSVLLGPAISNSTRNLLIQNRTLFVSIDSAVMRHELFMIRSQILLALNKSVGSKVIDQIVFK
jgi:predicted nucleic acid-binding Zn ribbon protein